MKDRPLVPTATELKSRRKALGLSQRQMAQWANVHHQTIYRLEKGIHRNCYRLRAILDAVLNSMETGQPIRDPEIRAHILGEK